MESSENFVKECFAKRIFFFKEIFSIGKYLTLQPDTNDKIRKYRELREAMRNLKNNQQNYNYSFVNLYKYLKEGMVDPTTGQVDIESLIYVKSVIVNNFKDYGLFRLKQKHLIETTNKSS
jgi:hypothetical protein